MSQKYTVGYKKPPREHQFKPGNLGGRKKASEKRGPPDFASLLDQPLRARRGEKIVALDPFEAGIQSLVREAINGKPRALKEILKIFEKEGLLNAPVGRQTHGSLIVPKGFSLAAYFTLLTNLGYPPWDPEVLAAAKSEYAQDKDQIRELYQDLLKGNANG
jgi:hypothetical protein